ncbi:gluconokinase [Pseudonocardia eucalypti]|uniref:Gluconokinase n=1 Tax=Pseudonocardia eucalypti TaxID=648755 RepID=A0ABP9PZ69_9PSEU
MGVSGAGKTTVGRLLAERLDVPYAEADDFHPPANIAKMSAGIPLTDEDRWPWLDALAGWIAGHAGTGGVVTCSALKRVYRDRLRAAGGNVWFLHLRVDRQVLAGRVAHRPGHFMPAALLDSQLADLQPLEPDEPGLTVDASATPEAVVDAALTGRP